MQSIHFLCVLIAGLLLQEAAADDWSGACDIHAAAQDYYDTAPVHIIRCVNETQHVMDLAFDDHAAMMDIFTGDTANVTGDFQPDGKLRVKHYKRNSREHGNGDGMGMGMNKAGATVRSAAVIILRIVKSDGTYVSGTDVPNTIATTVNNTLFGVFSPSSHPTLAGLWNSCSLGQLSLNFDVDKKVNSLAGTGADIFYVDIPFTCTTSDPYCTTAYDSSKCTSNENYGWPQYAFNKLAATVGFVKSTWQHHVLIWPSGSGEMGCNFVGMGNIGCSSSYCYSWIPSSYANQPQDFAHEMGHNLGLPHAGSNLYASTSSSHEYGDFSCAMGFCCVTRCYGAPHAVQLGWLAPSATVNSASLGSGSSVTLTLASMTRSATGTIKITTDWLSSGSTTYWLQYKLFEQYDAYMSSSSNSVAFGNAVGVKQWNMGSYELSLHMTNLVAGNTWTDPSATVTVTVNSLDASGGNAVVTITRVGGAAAAASATPSPTVAASASASQTVPASASASQTVPASASPTRPASASASQTVPASASASQTVPASVSASPTRPAAAAASASASQTVPASPSASQTVAASPSRPASASASQTVAASPTRAAASASASQSVAASRVSVSQTPFPTASVTRAAAASPTPSPTRKCGSVQSGKSCVTSSQCSSCSCAYSSSKKQFLCA